jgi:lysylphosphatidylglycerol synthetase-like protein (DUF2156 family)
MLCCACGGTRTKHQLSLCLLLWCLFVDVDGEQFKWSVAAIAVLSFLLVVALWHLRTRAAIAIRCATLLLHHLTCLLRCAAAVVLLQGIANKKRHHNTSNPMNSKQPRPDDIKS